MGVGDLLVSETTLFIKIESTDHHRGERGVVCLSFKQEKGGDSAGPSAGGTIGQWPWVSDEQSEEAPTPCVPLAHPTLLGMTVSTPRQGDIWRHTCVTDGLGSMRTRGNRLGNSRPAHQFLWWMECPEKDTS